MQGYIESVVTFRMNKLYLFIFNDGSCGWIIARFKSSY